MRTRRLYWEDERAFTHDAIVCARQADAVAFDQTCFYPGGGGQPCDEGCAILAGGVEIPITGARADDEGVIWHFMADAPVEPGQSATLKLDGERRTALMRHHTVLHVLNTIVLRDYEGWITGAQIGAAQSRIDFRLEGLSAAMCGDLETKVNRVLTAGHLLKAYFLPEAEFRERPDLLRTLEVKPPVIDGRVRVVEIEGFDAQACGGTHTHTTAEVGRFSIVKTENKGRINKRLYVRLD